MVSTITKSLTQNLVITTTPDFNAKYLLQHQDAWRSLIAYKEAKEDIQYFKVIFHSIPLRDFSHSGGLETIKDEINTFNKELELKIVGTPYWLTSETKRAEAKLPIWLSQAQSLDQSLPAFSRVRREREMEERCAVAHKHRNCDL